MTFAFGELPPGCAAVHHYETAVAERFVIHPHLVKSTLDSSISTQAPSNTVQLELRQMHAWEQQRADMLGTAGARLARRIQAQRRVAADLCRVNETTRAVARSLRAECSLIRQEGRSQRSAFGAHMLRALTAWSPRRN